MTISRTITDLLERTGGVVSRRAFPELAGQFDTLRRHRILLSVLPGVYVHRDVASDWRTRCTAVAQWDPDALIVSEAAAALTFWPRYQPSTIEVVGRRTTFRRQGFRFSERTVPAEFVTTSHGIRISDPAFTAVDLIPWHGGDVIDDALRSRMATLPAMHRAAALTPGRRQNADRRAMLLDSRDEPWSRGERLAHRCLRSAGITGWRTNVRIVCGGHVYFLDIAMEDCPVVIEVDGRIHARSDLFESDRERGNHLLLAGKQVLHFTTRMLTRDPDGCMAMVRAALAAWR